MRDATGSSVRRGHATPAPVGASFVSSYALAYMSVALMLIAPLAWAVNLYTASGAVIGGAVWPGARPPILGPGR